MQPFSRPRVTVRIVAACALPAFLCVAGRALPAQEPAPAGVGGRAAVQELLVAHCVKCHGRERSKGDVTLHDLGDGPGRDGGTERWELVLDMLRSGEMPPEDERQPRAVDRARVVDWIDRELRAFVARGDEAGADAAPVARRLTNFEYHNTMRDLLGVELELVSNLPEDPSRPYRFRNAARYLLMGLEQLDRYEENARRAMGSVIVDPSPPKVHRKRQSWAAAEARGMPDPSTMQRDELGVFGNRNRTVANGMQVFEWPATGAFRIRVRASAILPEGTTEVPLQIMLGHDIVGVGASALSPAKPVGTLRLTNTIDEPRVYELTGRIEDFPSKPEHRYRRGGRIERIGESNHLSRVLRLA